MGGKVRINLTLTRVVLERFKKLVPNVSAEVDTFIARRVTELLGGEPVEDFEGNLHSLKARRDKLVVDTVKLERTLKTSPRFQEATDLLLRLGLKRDFSNVDELIPKFMSAWKGGESFMHDFINLVELARDKKRAERALTEMRRGSVKTEQPTEEGSLDSKPMTTAIVPFGARPNGFFLHVEEVRH